MMEQLKKELSALSLEEQYALLSPEAVSYVAKRHSLEEIRNTIETNIEWIAETPEQAEEFLSNKELVDKVAEEIKAEWDGVLDDEAMTELLLYGDFVRPIVVLGDLLYTERRNNRWKKN